MTPPPVGLCCLFAGPRSPNATRFTGPCAQACRSPSSSSLSSPLLQILTINPASFFTGSRPAPPGLFIQLFFFHKALFHSAFCLPGVCAPRAQNLPHFLICSFVKSSVFPRRIPPLTCPLFSYQPYPVPACPCEVCDQVLCSQAAIFPVPPLPRIPTFRLFAGDARFSPCVGLVFFAGPRRLFLSAR